MAGPAFDGAEQWRLVARALWRRVKARSHAGSVHRWHLGGGNPDRVLVAPPDLRQGDARVALDFYHGRFPLAGHMVETGGQSPFALPVAHEAWRRSLHGFRWLRHFRAAQTELAAANARALVGDWIAGPGRRLDGAAWRPGVAAERLIAWLQHSPTLLGGADASFRRQFLRALGLHVRFLRAAAPELPENTERLQARLALAFAALALPASAATGKRAVRRLSTELETQILPDGGHVSRNPAVLVELLLDLLPLRQTYAGAGREPPPALVGAIERMLPMLRFFRHRDGTLARFNGAGATGFDRVTAVLRHDDAQGAPLAHAPHSGYVRLAVGATVVIADVGAPPPPDLAAQAHAGCLSFEMSAGHRSIVVNSGIDHWGAADFRPLVRATAAHTTMTVNDTSQGRFVHSARFGAMLGAPLVGGPRRVACERLEAPGMQGFSAYHDGYLARWNIVHERELRLSENGFLLEGSDRLLTAGGHPTTALPAVLRFHLHPDVELFREPDGGLVLAVPRGGQWRFGSPDLPFRVEESIFFAGLGGPRRSRQIVLAFMTDALAEIRWRFHRTLDAA